MGVTRQDRVFGPDPVWPPCWLPSPSVALVVRRRAGRDGFWIAVETDLGDSLDGGGNRNSGLRIRGLRVQILPGARMKSSSCHHFRRRPKLRCRQPIVVKPNSPHA